MPSVSDGYGTGIRALNLTVNRSLQPVQKSRFEFTTCLSRVRRQTLTGPLSSARRGNRQVDTVVNDTAKMNQLLFGRLQRPSQCRSTLRGGASVGWRCLLAFAAPLRLH